MTKVSLSDFRRIQSLAKARKSRRLEKRADNAALIWSKSTAKATRTRVRPRIKRGALKSAIVRLLGLLDAKKNGKWCRLGTMCPDYAKIGIHGGTLAYHLVPAQRGDSTRFVPENVVWCCRAANYGEVMNRSLYRYKHISVFGSERILRLEEKAREIRQYSYRDLLDLREEIKRQLETES